VPGWRGAAGARYGPRRAEWALPGLQPCRRAHLARTCAARPSLGSRPGWRAAQRQVCVDRAQPGAVPRDDQDAEDHVAGVPRGRVQPAPERVPVHRGRRRLPEPLPRKQGARARLPPASNCRGPCCGCRRPLCSHSCGRASPALQRAPALLQTCKRVRARCDPTARRDPAGRRCAPCLPAGACPWRGRRGHEGARPRARRTRTRARARSAAAGACSA